MIPASADFLTQEARRVGALPQVWLTFGDKAHSTGLGQSGGSFQESSYVAPDRIQADYHGFPLGYYQSPALAAGLGRYPSPAVFSWDWNTPGYEMSVFFRSARTLAILDALAWSPVAQGVTVQFYAFYQWGVEWRGYRCWALDDGEAEDDFTAYAVDDDDLSNPLVGYAAAENHLGDREAYIIPDLLGEYPVGDNEVAAAGRLTCQAQLDFSELVVGDHTGLVLSNRDGKFNPDRENFIWASEPGWAAAKKWVRVELGYEHPYRRTPEMITVYRGRLENWGPAQRAVDEDGKLQEHTLEVYSKNLTADLLNYPLGLPDADGNPKPYCAGTFLAEAKKISGRPLVLPVRTVDFETSGLEELDGVLTAGGGTVTLARDLPISGTQFLRCAVAGANQTAMGQLRFSRPPGEFMAILNLRLTAMPETLKALNFIPLQLLDSAGAELLALQVGHSCSKMEVRKGGLRQESSWEMPAYATVPVELGIWISPAPGGKFKVWINNDEVLNWATGGTVQELRVGALTAGQAEAWTVDVDRVRLYTKYHDQAFVVDGGPFADILTVYKDNVAQQDDPDNDNRLDKFPELGAVVFRPHDKKDVSGTVMLKVKKNELDHPADQIADLCTLAGAGALIDTAAFARVKAATPDYQTGVRLEGGSAADGIRELCSRCLFNFFEDHGVIGLVAFTGNYPPPPDPLTPGVNYLTVSELREMRPQIVKAEVKNRVVCKYGWYDRNPYLQAEAGLSANDPEANPAEIDLSYSAPVATDSRRMAELIAARLLPRLGPQKLYDSIRTDWGAARLELGESLRLEDAHLLAAALDLEVTVKEVNLDPPREVSLQGLRFLSRGPGGWFVTGWFSPPGWFE